VAATGFHWHYGVRQWRSPSAGYFRAPEGLPFGPATPPFQWRWQINQVTDYNRACRTTDPEAVVGVPALMFGYAFSHVLTRPSLSHLTHPGLQHTLTHPVYSNHSNPCKKPCNKSSNRPSPL
jgi:hypothetical protein